MPRRPFKGKINVDVRDSVPDWAPYMPPRAPEGSPNVLIVLFDDTGMAAWEPFGGRIRMPTLERLADGGLTLQPVAHHGAVLADALVHAHRPQPPPERHGLHRRGRDRLPGLERPPAQGVRHRRPGPARQRLEHLLGRQGPLRARRGGQPGRPEVQLAAAAGLRPLLRLHRRRDQPVVSDAGRGQPLDRPAVHARGGLPPVQGPRRPGAADDPRQPVLLAVAAVVHVVLPGRQPRAPPRADGVGRQVQGPVRRRLRGLPRLGAGAHGREGRAARGHRPDADQPDARGHPQPARRRAPVGLAVRRREAAVRPDGRGLRRLLRVHRPPGRADRRLPRGVRPARQHDRPLLRRQRRVGRGPPNGSVNENKFFNGWPDEMRGQPRAHRGPRQPRTPTTTTRPAGRWRSRRRTRCSSATRTPAGRATRWSSTGRRASRPRARCATSTTTSPTSSRRCWTAAASSSPTRSTASTRSRWRASRCATRSTRPTRRRRARASTTACSAPAASGRRAGRRSRSTGRPRASGTSTTTSGSSSTSTRTAPRRTTSPPSTPTSSSSSIEVWFEEAGKYDVLPLDDRHPWEIIADVRPQTEPDRDTYIYYPHTAEVPEAAAPNIRGALVQGPRRGRDRERRRRGRDLRPGRALRRPRAVPQGPAGALRLQLPRRPARAALLVGRAGTRSLRDRDGLRQGGRRRARRGDGHHPAARRRQASWPRGRCAPRSGCSRSAATACASGATRATR